MPSVRILEAAAAEAAGAAAWYESQRAGLGTDFPEDFKAVLDTLEEGIVPGSPWPGRVGERGGCAPSQATGVLAWQSAADWRRRVVLVAPPIPKEEALRPPPCTKVSVSGLVWLVLQERQLAAAVSRSVPRPRTFFHCRATSAFRFRGDR
jgi:hypothetical protein